MRFPARHSRYNTHDLTCLAVGRDEPTDGRSVPEWAALYGQFLCHRPVSHGGETGPLLFRQSGLPHPTTMIRLVHCGIAARTRREGRRVASVVRGLAILEAPAPSPAGFHRTHSCEISRTPLSINPHDLTCLAVGRDGPPLAVSWPSWERRRPRRHGCTGRTRVRFPARLSRSTRMT